MSKKVVSSDKAPAAVASYSQAIASNGFLFCSGQVHLDPASSELAGDSIQEQTSRCLDNLSGVLEAAGVGWADVVKVNAYLVDLPNDYAGFNETYAAYIEGDPPARAAIGVAALPLGARVEIECIAFTG